jgi:hypothetical protein
MALNSVFSWFITKRIHQIELFMRHPHEVQEELLSYLIDEASITRFGFDHRFSKIKNIHDFKKAIPVRTYEDFRPYIDLVKEGEQSVLWPGRFKWFAKSSGTTDDKSKFIPVSTEALEDCHYKGGKDMLALYYNLVPDAKIYTGKTLVVGGSSKLNTFHNGSYTGDLSAIIINNLPPWAEIKRTPSKDIALMENWEEKIEAMADATIKENVTNIAGVPSWTLLLIQRICEKANINNVGEIWPNLQLYFHGGVSFLPYRSEFEKVMPAHVNYMETYNASEGFFGIQDQLNTKDMLLMLDYGIFYEFMPLEELGKENPSTLQLDEVELDQSYAIVISTNAGLWRYLLGDTVSFTSKNPYRIQVTGRTKQFINVVGEELMVDNAERAIAMTSKTLNCSVRDYTVCPITHEGNQHIHHHWLIEFLEQPESIRSFTELLDQNLQSLNSDYEAKRKGNLNLQMLTIQVAPKDTFHHWLKSRNRLGGQNKVPRLHNNDKYMESLQSQIQEHA